MAKKEYQSQDINDMFQKLSGPKKIIVLIQALSFMEQYNGRSKIACIAMSMGYESDGMGHYTKID